MRDDVRHLNPVDRWIITSLSLPWIAVALACGTSVEIGAESPTSLSGGTGGDDGTDSTGDDPAEDEGTTTGQSQDAGSGDEGDTTGTIKLDVGNGDTGPSNQCEVDRDDGAAPGPCDQQAPADSFAPVVQWEFSGDNGRTNSATTPLVANLTDDNGDGAIDLCDTPDVVVLLWEVSINQGPAYLYVLDGETGDVHFSIETGLDDLTPALGDLDGDGVPEIVAQQFGGGPIVFDHEGQVVWSTGGGVHPRFNAISLADLDNDGDVELVFPGVKIWDHEGNVVLPARFTGFWEGSAPVAVDLDGDDDLEILDDLSAFHHDGTPHWDPADLSTCPGTYQDAARMPVVADFDGDGGPEVFISGGVDTPEQFCLVDADGTVLATQTDLAGAPDANNFLRPPAVHDVDGDGSPDIALGGSSSVPSSGYFAVIEVDGSTLSPMFVRDDIDESGNSGATAFDFLGDGTAEAIYMDHTQLFAYDANGDVELQVGRSSYTQIEYPVVADVDNDGSAEFIVTSNGGEAPVRVFADAEDRWIPARRIWNQHTYHVTNVREDGTIPAVEPPHWQALNTFRTQAQITTGGGTCRPEG